MSGIRGSPLVCLEGIKRPFLYSETLFLILNLQSHVDVVSFDFSPASHYHFLVSLKFLITDIISFPML
jgi:hypothetical protein